MKTILLISPYWKEDHRWMVSSVKLAELWQRLGYRVVVLCMGKTNNQTIVNYQLSIVNYPDLFLPDPWNYGIAWGFGKKALDLARDIKPDVIVVNKVLFWSSISLLRLRLAGFKVLLLTDALVGITWWPRTRLAKICSAIYAWTLGWLILKAATTIVFFHPQPPSILRKLGIAKKSMVIPTGIDRQKYRRSDQKNNYQLSIINYQLVITYLGRLESIKGVDDFAAAVSIAKKSHPEIRVQIVGWAKPDHPLLKQYRSIIDFTGLRHDIPEILAATDIFVLPSHAEGLSNALMEAMASGCACVASDVGGNRFLIENGISGFLYPAGDIEALASHLRRLIEDPEKRFSLGRNARKRIEEKFDWERVGKEYRRLLEEWGNQIFNNQCSISNDQASSS